MAIDPIRMHDLETIRGTVSYIAGAITGVHSEKPTMTVDNIMDILEEMQDNLRKEIYDAIRTGDLKP